MIHEQELIISVPQGSVSGTLALPETGKASRTVIFLHSSERSHRNEDYFQPLAAYAAERGIATFRYNSPGSGDSPGNAFMQSMGDRTEEALAILHTLAGDNKLGAVGFSGLSEGAVISLMAAHRAKECAFLVPVSLDVFPFNAERLLQEAEEELQEANHTPERIRAEMAAFKYWLAFWGVYKPTPAEQDLPGNAGEPEKTAWRAWKELKNASADEQHTAILKIQKEQSRAFPDYLFLEYCLNDIADRGLSSRETARNRELWQEFTSADPRNHIPESNLPLFCAWGENDWMGDAEGSRKYMEKAQRGTLKTYPGAGHSLELEDGSFSIGFFDDFCTWVGNSKEF